MYHDTLFIVLSCLHTTTAAVADHRIELMELWKPCCRAQGAVQFLSIYTAGPQVALLQPLNCK